LSKGLKNKIIREYHDLTLYEFQNGLSIDDIEFMLYEYQDKELYLECAGIYKAMEWIKFSVLTNVIKIIDKNKTQIKIKNYDNGNY
tara:strand:+ start:5023 stop:5280 length:258 start_codon:yes stop_codon:yes gene_type:complete